MTRKEIIKQLDIKDDDKICFIRHRRAEDGRIDEQKVTIGFPILELLGAMEVVKADIINENIIRKTYEKKI